MGIKDGEVASSDEVMNAMGSIFNDAAQNLFNADYIGFDSRLYNSGVPNLKNVKYSTFTSDDADVNYGFNYDSANDLYTTVDVSGLTEYVIIEATDAVVSWSSNDCVLTKIASGKWLLYCTVGTAAVQRAQMIKSLFNGAGGLALDFTSITAIKTSHANDVGKQCHYATAVLDSRNDSPTTGNYTGTFANTATNDDCSVWSYCNSGDNSNNVAYEFPNGTAVNSANGNNTSDELGTDREADEKDNQATVDHKVYRASGIIDGSSTVSAIVLSVGDITWVATGGAGGGWSYSNIDFLTDNAVPLFTAADNLTNEGLITSTLIFKDTVVSTNNAIPVINSTIDATSSQVISVSANGGSAYTTVNNTEIARPTAGTALWRKIVITRTDLSKLDLVTEQAVKYSLY